MNTKRVTVIERSYDEDGNLVKEVETITEYEQPQANKYWNNPYAPYQPYQPPNEYMPLKVTYTT